MTDLNDGWAETGTANGPPEIRGNLRCDGPDFFSAQRIFRFADCFFKAAKTELRICRLNNGGKKAECFFLSVTPAARMNGDFLFSAKTSRPDQRVKKIPPALSKISAARVASFFPLLWVISAGRICFFCQQ